MTRHSRLLQLVLRILGPVWRFRPIALLSELVFWNLWLRRRSADGSMAELLRADRPVHQSLRTLIEQVPGDPVRILEVGAGPIASVGLSHPTRRLEITATDVLADEYDRVLRWRGISPPIRTIYADAECLTTRFGANAFDLVYAANCVDHMQNPLAAIREMVGVLRPGGHVVMDHMLDEGAHQNYAGLHQWNLRVENGRLLLWNRRQRHDLSVLLASSCDVRASCSDGNLHVEIRKREEKVR